MLDDSQHAWPTPGVATGDSAQALPNAWRHVASSDWRDWRWQLKHRLSTVEDFARIIHLSEGEEVALRANPAFRVDVTPYFAALMDPSDPNCPIRRQVLPSLDELHAYANARTDPLAEDGHSPVPGIVHRYPDRVLMLPTTQCASYCRFCTRSRIVGDPHVKGISLSGVQTQVAYIASHPEIKDVLISGGDPLTLSDKILESILASLRGVGHVEIIRFGTRVPVFLPQRITPAFVALLRQFQTRSRPIYMNIHFNHPKEVTADVEEALWALADGGIPLGSQTVLLAGVNDCPNVMQALMDVLTRNRVKPYYLYQCDPVVGAEQFRTPVAKGKQIVESLRGHTSGYKVPLFVVDMPGGGGKVPVMPTYEISESDNFVVFRNYEGMISSYPSPFHYTSHAAKSCSYCLQAHQQASAPQRGIRAILAGEISQIVPAGQHSETQP